MSERKISRFNSSLFMFIPYNYTLKKKLIKEGEYQDNIVDALKQMGIKLK